MKLKQTSILFFFIFFLFSCADYKINKKPDKIEKQYYSSSGFTLIYDDELFLAKVVNKKINNNDIVILHNFLKKNTPVKIINPENSMTVEAKILRKANYPQIFNSVISEKVALLLELDSKNPFVEIIELKKNETFIAKEGSIFDEEKTVADKAPVDQIKMNDLSISIENNKKKSYKNNNFIIVISDFYYKESAINLKNELVKKINLNKILVKKINNNKYRLLVGPFKNFNALKNTYISLNNLGFEYLNIIRE